MLHMQNDRQALNATANAIKYLYIKITRRILSLNIKAEIYLVVE